MINRRWVPSKLPKRITPSVEIRTCDPSQTRGTKQVGGIEVATE